MLDRTECERFSFLKFKNYNATVHITYLVYRYNTNIDALKRTQSDQMGKWRKEAEAMCDWLDSMEDQLESLDIQGGNQDIKDVYRHLEECEVREWPLFKLYVHVRCWEGAPKESRS